MQDRKEEEEGECATWSLDFISLREELPHVIFQFASTKLQNKLFLTNLMKLTLLLLLGSLMLVIANSSCSEGCIDCDQASSNCSACAQGYQLDIMGTCIRDTTIQNCALYGPLDFCLLCMPTYELQNGTCEKVYSGCLVQNSALGVCVQCGFGTSLVDGLCKGVINCKTGKESCSECSDGFLLVNGSCVDNSGNCETKNERGICSVCKQNYTLVGYECIRESLSVFGCNVYRKNGQCIACKIGFANYQGYCLLQWWIAGIQQGQLTLADVLQQNNITKFEQIPNGESGHSVDANLFGGNNFTDQNLTLDNATSSNDNHHSHVNNSATTIDSGNITQSYEFTSTQIAQTNTTNTPPQNDPLSTTNTTSSNNSTSSTNSSTSSGDGLILIHPANTSNPPKPQPGKDNTTYAITTTTATNTTISSIPNCAVAENGKCKTCNPNYTNTPNGCILVARFCQVYDTTSGKCQSCNYNLVLQNNTCHDPYCLVQSNGCCTQCFSFFSLNSDGVCVFYDPNCANISSSRCITCNAGYFVTSQGFCFSLPANCSIANSQTYACMTCLHGYQLNAQGGCDLVIKITIPNCFLVDTKGNCLQCNTGYNLTNNSCLAMSVLCQKYNTSNGGCIACINGCILENGVCKDPNCAIQHGHSCASCFGGYYLLNHLCTIIPIANCMTVDSNGSCIQCKDGYALSNGSCTVNSQPIIHCQSYNLVTGICINCIPGYVLTNNTCLPSSNNNTNNNNTANNTTNNSTANSTTNTTTNTTTNNDPNCLTFSNGTCLNCSFRYYFSTLTKLCAPVDPQCSTYSIQTGACLTCYSGYTLTNGSCILSVPSNNQDPNCKVNASEGCSECYSGYYYSTTYKKCVPFNPQCKTSNSTDGSCLSCYSGYTLVNKTCAVVSNSSVDPNCKRTSPSSICLQCSDKYYLSEGVCKQVSPLCKTYNSTTGCCLSCYPGYSLQGSTCTVSSNIITIDTNCKTFSNSRCTECYQGYYLGSGNKCMQNNPLCKTIDTTNGRCTSCYTGYALSAGNCQLQNSNNADPNCKTNDTQGTCTACYQGYYLNANKRCTLANALCKTFTPSQANCTSCYPGYTLTNGDCIASTSNATNTTSSNTTSNDPYCKSADKSGVCTACYQGYYLNANKICTLANALCKTYTLSQDKCTSCYDGYTLTNGDCIASTPTQTNTTANTDPNCKSSDNSGSCTACYQGYYLNSNKKCILANTLCKTYSPSQSNCTSCYDGYTLSNGDCVISAPAQTNTTSSDPYCKSTDQSGVCTACYQGYYLNANKHCVLANTLCKTYTPSQASCTSCYDGYTLTNGDCVISANQPSDPYCKSYDAAETCTACYQGYYLNANKQCVLSNPLCKTYTPSQASCTSCYNGYTLTNDGDCVVSQTQTNNTTDNTDPNCKSADASGTCTACYQGYYLNANKVCTLANAQCKTYTPSQEKCTSCYDGYALSSGDCILSPNQSNSNSSTANNTTNNNDANCKSSDNTGTCTACYQGYYLNSNKVCVIANALCKTYTPSQSSCTSCYDGYTLTDGDCLISAQNNTDNNPSTDPNCKSTDNSVTCTACYQGYYLNANKHCVLANALCKTYTPSQANCTSCYDGYTLTNGDCIYSSDSTSGNDPYCLTRQNGSCISCVGGYYLNKNSACTLANPICKTVDSTGSCTSCYAGYSKQGNTCIISQDITIPNCQTANGTICTACNARYYLSNGECVAVVVHCATYNSSTGVCLTCESGYTIKAGVCVQTAAGSDANCETYAGSKCSRCKQGYVLQGRLCVAADPNCLAFDPSCHFCLACAGKLTPKGFHCV